MPFLDLSPREYTYKQVVCVCFFLRRPEEKKMDLRRDTAARDVLALISRLCIFAFRKLRVDPVVVVVDGKVDIYTCFRVHFQDLFGVCGEFGRPIRKRKLKCVYYMCMYNIENNRKKGGKRLINKTCSRKRNSPTFLCEIRLFFAPDVSSYTEYITFTFNSTRLFYSELIMIDE